MCICNTKIEKKENIIYYNFIFSLRSSFLHVLLILCSTWKMEIYRCAFSLMYNSFGQYKMLDTLARCYYMIGMSYVCLCCAMKKKIRFLYLPKGTEFIEPFHYVKTCLLKQIFERIYAIRLLRVENCVFGHVK